MRKTNPTAQALGQNWRPTLLLSLVLSLLLSACASAPRTPAVKSEVQKEAVEEAAVDAAEQKPAPTSVMKLPRMELTGAIVYEMLLAEIAGNRGSLRTALVAYADLARSTRDPRIVRRAAEVAVFARQPQYVVDLAQLWVELEPESLPARQTLVTGLVNNRQFLEAEPHVLALMTLERAKAGEVLIRLAGSVASTPNKQGLAEMLKRLAASRPDLPEAHLVGSLGAQILGDLPKAIQESDLAVQARPDWEAAVLYRAQLLRESGKIAESLDSLRVFLERRPKARDARLQYGRSLVAEKRYDDALQQYRLLDSQSPNNPDILHVLAPLSMQAGDLDTAEKSYKALLNLGAGNSNSLSFALGQLEEMRQRPEQALPWYEAVLSGDQFVPARLRYAVILSKSKGADAGVAYLGKLLAAGEGERIPLLMGQAQLLRDANRNSESYAVLHEALKNSPDNHELLYETALAAEKIGKGGEMETHMRRLIQLKPGYAHAYNALGYSLAERGERLDEALALIRKALELAPGDPFILDSLGWVQFRRGELSLARQALTEALAQRQDPEIAAHLGEVLWAMGQQTEATATWRKAAKQTPDNETLLSIMKKYLPEGK